MAKNVFFNDKIIALAEQVAPTFEFSKFAQMAVREELQRRGASLTKSGGVQ